MTEEPDFDALVTLGALDDADRRARLEALRQAADAAFRVDVSYSIEMAKASWAAVEKRDARAEGAKRLRAQRAARRVQARQG